MNNEMKIVIISSIGTLFIALLSGYLSYHWSLSSQKKIYNHQMRLQTYSELLGYRQLLSQLFVSRFEALIYSDYHEYRWKIQGAPGESIDKTEAIRWMHKSEDLVIEISKEVQNLFKTIGAIRVLFNDSPELQKLSNNIFNYKNLEIIQRPNENWSLEQIEEWKLKSVSSGHSLVDENISIPIKKLVTYLENELKREK